MGLITDEIRLPLVSLSEEYTKKLTNVLNKIGVTLVN